jgi:ribonuclease R
VSGPTGPAPADGVVAVLQRRGRFLTALPLFAPASDGERTPRRHGSPEIVLASVRSGRARDGAAGVRAGDLVLVRPARRSARASVERVLGRPEIARDVIEGLMLDRGLARGFREDVEREARGAGERVAADGVGGRRDLRGLATFTVDPASARDFDDAISAEAHGGRRASVWVHIADVAAHVPEGSLVDREAHQRATSVYVPGAVEPMLPHALSSEACSLRPGADRAAVTVELSFDGDRLAGAEFYRSLIRSDARLDYDQVDRVFAGREQARDPWAAPLEAARAVAAALAERRERGGALAIDSHEPEFAFDADGEITAVRGRAQTESHRLIEHLMIAANEAVAAFLARRKTPCLYRVHERPDPERVKRLVAQLASLEVSTPPVPDPLSSTQAAELLGPISRRVEEHVARSGRGGLALGSLVLRSLKQAYYSPTNLGHAGLRSTAYCHFTSPIRRYPDIVCHRALLSCLGEQEAAPRAGALGELGAWTSEREREAMRIERDADDVARCFALQHRLERGDPLQGFDGEVAGLISAGAFVAFGDAGPAEAPPYEGLLPVRLLRLPAGSGREWWELNEEGTILRGERTGATLRLGDPVHVRAGRIEAPRGRVELIPAG